ncbi:MAG: helix-turn-helix transcriptional regulator [Deltaproteobacteria bacterium]|nr:helix-turn-helix transcriptional regulator [Deltaproteobacteria bacterium]
MSKKNFIKINCLRLYRKKHGLSQKRTAYLMGLKTASALSHYERGDKVPGLKNALKLEIVLHTPAAFLFRELNRELKKEIEARRKKWS